MAGRAPRWFIAMALLALAAYVLFLTTKTTAAAGASDSSGYLNGARLLAAGRLQAEIRLPPEFQPATAETQRAFMPLGFVTAPRVTHMIPAYATGLPLHFALASKVFGWRLGPHWVEWFAAGLAVWLCYLVGRELGVSPFLAAAGATALAVCPIFIFTSIQALSDTLATTWCLAALYCALRARARRVGIMGATPMTQHGQDARATRPSVRWAAACGLAFSIAVLVRLTNLFLAPALLVLIGFEWRKLLGFALAGTPAAAWVAFYNHQQFGGVLATGYGNVDDDFSWANVAPTLIHFAKWLGLLLPGIMLVLPFAALMHRPTRGREWFALGLGFAAIAGFYLFYDISQQVWWCLRYVLPVVPWLIAAALLGVEALARGLASRWKRTFPVAMAALIAVWAMAGSVFWSSRLHVLLVQRYEQTYADAGIAARDRIPQDALVVANNFSGTIHYYTDFPVLRADVVLADEFARYAAIAQKAGRPVYAVLFDFEEEEALRQRCPGKWTRLSTLANVGYWRLEQ